MFRGKRYQLQFSIIILRQYVEIIQSRGTVRWGRWTMSTKIFGWVDHNAIGPNHTWLIHLILLVWTIKTAGKSCHFSHWPVFLVIFFALFRFFKSTAAFMALLACCGLWLWPTQKFPHGALRNWIFAAPSCVKMMTMMKTFTCHHSVLKSVLKFTDFTNKFRKVSWAMLPDHVLGRRSEVQSLFRLYPKTSTTQTPWWAHSQERQTYGNNLFSTLYKVVQPTITFLIQFFQSRFLLFSLSDIGTTINNNISSHIN